MPFDTRPKTLNNYFDTRPFGPTRLATWHKMKILQLSVKAAETTEGRVDRVRTVRGADDDHLPSALQTVHQSEQLRDHALLDLAIRLITLGRNGVQLIDEDDRGRVLEEMIEMIAFAKGVLLTQ